MPSHNCSESSSRQTRRITIALMLSLFIVSGGCSRKPKAPVLTHAPFYQNNQEGFRFLVPEGWRQTAAANLPPGDLTHEVYLVRYVMNTPDAGGTMLVLVIQETSPVDIGEHLAGPSFGVQKWKAVEPKEDITINNVPLEHHFFQAKMGGREMVKDVYALRKNGRIYSFIGLYAPSDDYARQQIQRAMQSLQSS